MADNRNAKSTSKPVTQAKLSPKSQGRNAGTENNKVNRANEDRRKQADRRTNTDRRATQDRRDTAAKSVATTAQKSAVKTIAKPSNERTTEKGVVNGSKKGNETKNHSQIAAVRAKGSDSDKKLRKTSKREPGSRKPGTELTKAEQKSKK